MSESSRRVLLIAPRHPSTSGGSTVVSNLSQAFRQAGHYVETISVYPPDALSPPTAPDHVVFVNEQRQRHSIRAGDVSTLLLVPRVIRKRVERRRSLRRLRRRIEALRPCDVVIFTHVMGKALLDEAGYKRPLEGAPLLIGQHHSSFESLKDEPSLTAALPLHFSGCDAFVALTERDAALFRPLVGVPSVAIPNPASNALPGMRDALAQRAIALARFSHEKQIPLMIELFAAALRTEEGRGWTLTVYGDGETRAEAEARIRDLRVQDAVSLPGTTDDAQGAMSGSSLNLLCSTFEGLSMTILEAAQAGIPTVAYACSSGVEAQLADDAGWLVPDQDASAFISALRHAMSSVAERERRGDRARQRAQTYNPREIVDRWENLWKSLRP